MLPFRFFVRCLLRAIARTGAVLLSTEHWSQATVMITFTCESSLGDPVAARFRLVIGGGEVPYNTPPQRALLACCLPNLFAVRHWGRGPLGPNAHI